MHENVYNFSHYIYSANLFSLIPKLHWGGGGGGVDNCTGESIITCVSFSVFDNGVWLRHV
jgi:hypothetical protein